MSTQSVGFQFHSDPAGQHSAFSEGWGADPTGERRRLGNPVPLTF